MDTLTAAYLVLGVAGVIGLSLFAVWILAPAWTSYGRTWERIAAAILSVFVLTTFAATGVGLGLLIIFYWDDIAGIFGAASAFF